MRASGYPICLTILSVEEAKLGAGGLAFPMSSEASIAKRRAINSAGSPPSMSLAK